MLKDITLGQYFPGNSLIHRLDPRIKLILSLFYIVIIFLCKNVWSFVFILFVTAALVLISKIPFKMILKSLKPILFIIAFTTVINIFFTTGDTLIFEFHFIKIYLEGLMNAALIIVRIVVLLTGVSVILTYTTSPIALTDAIERLLMPLRYLKIPVHEFAMMMTIALRFIPTLISETDKIMSAQKARGVDFSRGNLVQRAKALIPVLIPLLVSSIRRATDLATAMECRCYRGGDGRTRMTQLTMHAKDCLMLVAFVFICAGVVLINTYAPGFAL